MLWIKKGSRNIRVEQRFEPVIYLQPDKISKKWLVVNNVARVSVRKLTYMRDRKRVFAVFPGCKTFEKVIAKIEKDTKYQSVLYDADVKPEYQYLYKNNLQPFCEISLDEASGEIKRVDSPRDGSELRDSDAMDRDNSQRVILKSMQISFDAAAERIVAENEVFFGEGYLRRFADFFVAYDPDVIYMDYAFSQLPVLNQKLLAAGIKCPFHRWSVSDSVSDSGAAGVATGIATGIDDAPIVFKGGTSFISYGRVKYHEYAIRLHGRFLVDTSTVVGDECETDAIIELCELSAMGFQQVASRSFGATFQFKVIHELFLHGMLIPYKEKPIDDPRDLMELLKMDRSGQILDPKTGFHTEVAEIDFSCMFPWIIHNHNISAETILTGRGPFSTVPGTTIRISRRWKGITPKVIKPFIEQRMYYKRHPTAWNKARSVGLKMVLVSSYGYLRFREFKLGLASAHMAICAYARHILFQAIDLAHKHGFEVVHGIVDALYIKRKGITAQQVKAYCDELEQLVGIPVSFEGIFKWVCFCSSVNDPDIPVPTKHFGVFLPGSSGGDIKARGIEVRERNKPKIVRGFQTKVLGELHDLDRRDEIRDKLPRIKEIYLQTLASLPSATAQDLQIRVNISDTQYTTEIPQKKIVAQYKKKGIKLMPGQVISYVHTTRGVVMAQAYSPDIYKPNIEEYEKLLFRSLLQVCQPFGVTADELRLFLELERQTNLKEFYQFKQVYIPAPKKYPEYRGKAEQLVRRDLERRGWLVWRGGLIHYAGKAHEYPNVQRKYQLLAELLDKYHPDVRSQLAYICQVHHGMPDFVCYKDGRFLFVECKLAYETVKTGQRICAQKLTDLGLEVQIHRIVHEPTKVRVAYVNTDMKRVQVVDRQRTLDTGNMRRSKPTGQTPTESL